MRSDLAMAVMFGKASLIARVTARTADAAPAPAGPSTVSRMRITSMSDLAGFLGKPGRRP